MMAMTERYQRNPGANKPGAASANFVLIQHCQALAASYAKAADEAEMMHALIAR
jgi:hypothetical protein